MRTQDLLNKIQVSRIVSCQQGAWKWQTPYKSADYHAKERKSDGALIFKATWHSQKATMKNIISSWGNHKQGSAQNDVVKMSFALECLGQRGVQFLLDHGFSFDC